MRWPAFSHWGGCLQRLSLENAKRGLPWVEAGPPHPITVPFSSHEEVPTEDRDRGGGGGGKEGVAEEGEKVWLQFVLM